MPEIHFNVSAFTLAVNVTPLKVFAGLLCIFLLHVVYRIYSKIFQIPSGVNLPPGPKGESLLGMLRQTPTYFPAKAYYKDPKWNQYGDLIFFHILGAPVLVINSAEAAVELLDKRGSNNSDRPDFHYAFIMGFNNTISFMRWGARFQLHRKVLQRLLNKSSISQYQAMQCRETRLLCQRFAEKRHFKGMDLSRGVRRTATSIILGIGFGHTIQDDNDPYIQIAVEASEGLDSVGGNGGVTILDFSPLFKYLPNFLASPGLKWARAHREATRRIHEVPCSAVQKEMAEGTAKPSLLKTLLDEITENPKQPLKVQDAQGMAVTMYSAGQDTTTNTFLSLVMNMLLHPEIQEKARAELDRVVGRDRLPEFEDRDSLPYLNNIIIETLRWFPATPLGLPHKTIKPEIYRGYYIPAGTVVFANALAMTHDPAVYKNPDEFDPERYGRGEPIPVGQWGFGRRVCVGQHLAGATIWIMIATILSTMYILPEEDAEGKPIKPTLVWEEGFRGRVAPYNCTLKWRDEHAQKMIEDSLHLTS